MEAKEPTDVQLLAKVRPPPGEGPSRYVSELSAEMGTRADGAVVCRLAFAVRSCPSIGAPLVDRFASAWAPPSATKKTWLDCMNNGKVLLIYTPSGWVAELQRIDRSYHVTVRYTDVVSPDSFEPARGLLALLPACDGPRTLVGACEERDVHTGRRRFVLQIRTRELSARCVGTWRPPEEHVAAWAALLAEDDTVYAGMKASIGNNLVNIGRVGGDYMVVAADDSRALCIILPAYSLAPIGVILAAIAASATPAATF